MDRIETRARARELLEATYLTAEGVGPDGDPDRAGLARLAREARGDGAPLDDHREGPWRSDRCRSRHGGGRTGEVTCVMRGEFELPLGDADAGDVAALLNWAEVPEPGAQT